MRKEVHLRLIKRVAISSLVAAIIVLAAALFLEVGRIEQELVSGAVKEGRIYSILYTTYLNKPVDENLKKLEGKAAEAAELTPYIYLDFLTSDKKTITHVAVPPGNDANQAFINKGITMIPSDHISSSWIMSNKRVYLKISTPVKTPENGTVIGYISGIYRLTPADTKSAVYRIIMTCGIGLSAVMVCGFLCYLGFLLLNNSIIRSVGELNRANAFLLRKLATALAKSDVMDAGHGLRLLIYAISLAEKVSLPRSHMRSLILGGFLHDLEMVPISHAILSKPGTLTKDEYNAIKLHPKNGAESIQKIKWLNSAGPIIKSHHEKYDGSGYPAGIKQEKIPTAARIIAIADTFDALTSRRPYRVPLSPEDALVLMDRESGSHFDPVMLSAFGQIALELHTTVSGRNEKELTRRLDTLLKKYLAF